MGCELILVHLLLPGRLDHGSPLLGHHIASRIACANALRPTHRCHSPTPEEAKRELLDEWIESVVAHRQIFSEFAL